MPDRIQIPIPQGELLPAEERLQNVLKAIEERMRDKIGDAHAMESRGEDSGEEYERLRAFIQGLDIAWSLANTEIHRRTDTDTVWKDPQSQSN